MYLIIHLLSFFFLLSLLASLSSSNPIFLCLMLISVSLLVGINLSLVFSKWLMLAILLIFLGGMMIMFIYVTALAGAQKFFVPENFLVLMFISLAFSLSINNYFSSTFTGSTMLEIYHFSFPLMLLFLVILLSTLFLSVKLVESFKGALKFFM